MESGLKNMKTVLRDVGDTGFLLIQSLGPGSMTLILIK